ncbi:hypothetical protein OHA77_13410 [Streptosporangium sp. NBC_01639]|uniref:hypothetical protein n=1 Tax=Streptosporangium sp. NBC_01639 TaxID=2975948 RepID=UPI003865C0E6|nr:hypothetical protein OHA77_13410 [Streptosporangium sp. NBC_01639]
MTVEWANQNLKVRAAREAVADEHELAAAMHRSLCRPQKRPHIVRAFFDLASVHFHGTHSVDVAGKRETRHFS